MFSSVWPGHSTLASKASILLPVVATGSSPQVMWLELGHGLQGIITSSAWLNFEEIGNGSETYSERPQLGIPRWYASSVLLWQQEIPGTFIITAKVFQTALGSMKSFLYSNLLPEGLGTTTCVTWSQCLVILQFARVKYTHNQNWL